MSNFLLDKRFGACFEEVAIPIIKHACPFSTVRRNITNGDDHGIDIIANDIESGIDIYFDVKAYKKPLYAKSFKGFFIETYRPLSGTPGWILDKTHKTDYYILFRDCELIESPDSITCKYRDVYIVPAVVLSAMVEAAMPTDVLDQKSIRSATGVIIPYEILKKYKYNVRKGGAPWIHKDA